ncbi:DUF4276 family protein [Crossiella sp. CA-258035]|uniref:DUF4276 family protein n=1 Tax=Crossiella sp. CA-258035 TaxID=2981138 RepID=UPI0024BC947A|nr:DUF4276 family protein [Crossiella sp. CA-258035]WHT18575.1 DUF4276 family protein [Crossiella sp. CA-258035]
MAEYQRIHLLVEGQTEEILVRELLGPELTGLGYGVTHSSLRGVSRWARVQDTIWRLLHDRSIAVLTTVIDYYAFPGDAPGMASRASNDPVSRVRQVEEQVAAAIGDPRFVPHLVLHETESWVFAAGDQLAAHVRSPQLATKLSRDCAKAGGPELVNDGPDSAPSKRLLRYHPGYLKTAHGPKAIQDLGLPALRAQCPHLDAWLAELARRAR